MKIRHIILLLAVLMTATVSQAQQGVGSWKVYSTFSEAEKVLDTPDRVFYLSNGQLYSYDKDSGETYNYSTGTKLSDTYVSDIFYNYDKDYLVVAYSNANMDLIDEDDRVYNMPDIKDAELKEVPEVKDVAFDGDRIYVATNFGVVVYSDVKKEVLTAGEYGKKITKVFVSGETLWLVESFKYHSIDKNGNIASFTNFVESAFGQSTDEVLALEGNLAVMLVDGRRMLRVFEMNPEKGKTEMKSSLNVTGVVKNLSRTADGGVMCHTYDRLYRISKDGEVTELPLTGSELESKKVGSVYENKNIAGWSGNGHVFMGSVAGLGEYVIKDGRVEKVQDAVKPEGLTFSKIGRLHTGASGRVYASSYGMSNIVSDFKTINGKDNLNSMYYINRLEDGEVVDITPAEFEVYKSSNQSLKTLPYGFKDGLTVAEIPGDPDSYLVGSFWEGLYVFKDGKQSVLYNEKNSTLLSILNGYRIQLMGHAFDKAGNLWVTQFIFGGDERQFHMLPADKVGKETVPSDWQMMSEVRESTHDGQILPCKHSNAVMYKDGNYQGPVSVIKTKGTPTVSDDELINSTELIDQDGTAYNYNYIYCMVEDNKGRVWIGTDNGVVEITNPDNIKDGSFRINHLKVPRNDGTNFADYLLDGEVVYSIAVDPSNRKWIATRLSGVYLVSADGDEILEHFDTTNSPLGGNTVYAVTCGVDNDVYFGTAYGLYEYRSMSAPAREDFSEVYAYPNPVRPEYTGWITITGLMENSLVKIADAAGNVFHQTMSEGGMAVWDGCDCQGRRVKTGVYYVYASHGADGEQNSGAVTKILVVN